MTREEILQNVNGHSIDVLFEHILSGVVSKEELYSYGLRAAQRPVLEDYIKDESERWQHCSITNDINSYRNYYKRYPQVGFHKVDKGCWENYATAHHSITSYQDYMNLFLGHAGIDDKRGIHYYKAEDEIEKFRIRIEEERKRIIEDMRQHPYKREYKTWDAIENLYKSGIITDEILIEEGIVPEHLIKTIKQPDMAMPQVTLNDLGKIPEGGTEVYFMGIPRSGKSCVLASFVFEASRAGLLDFLRNTNHEGFDHSEDYFYKLIQCIDNAASPESTVTDTVSLMQFNLYQQKKDKQGRLIVDDDKKRPICLVEISGECFNIGAVVSSRIMKNATKWDDLGCSQILKTSNRKLLFFLVDYSREIATPEDLSVEIAPEEQILSRALTTFKKDGTGPVDKDGCNQNCTFSKVDTVAIIVTKSDLMNVLQRDRRTECAQKYLESKYQMFTQQLKRVCKKYNINQANNNIPYLLPFSMGRFIIGNKIIYDNTDARVLLDFIIGNTRLEGVKGLLSSLW